MALILKLEDEAPSMVQKPKREESKCTKQDSHFSGWKVIVGPCDWEDYSVSKDGAERYRVHNLPRDDSPGVYELGVAVLPSGSGRVIKADQVVPVYVGQTDSARIRLPQYGRTGAHLGESCSFGDRDELICKGPGLFQKMLAIGVSIVFRWASMGTKSEALRTERELLDSFDYAWNTRLNASRRHGDVLWKIKKVSSKLTHFTTVVPRQIPFRQKQVGIRIKSSKMTSTEEKFSDYADRESRNLIPQVIKFGRSQPRLLLDGSGISHENTIVCGVAVGDASICRQAPVQGRKRCAEHKGIKNTGSTTASNRELVSNESHITREYTEICGAAASDGSTCKSPPVQGRKRCDEHKGMRNNTGSTAASNRELVSNESHSIREYTEICGAAASDGSTCKSPPVQGRKRCAEHKGMWNNTGSTAASNRELVSNERHITREYTEICGAAASDGSTCKSPPVQGRKRCAEHKGMWNNTGSTAASNREFVSYESCTNREYTEICGATTTKGSACRRPPVPGRKRCADHTGMWGTGSTTASNRGFVSYESRTSREYSQYTGYCGATTTKGSACRRAPVPGNMRCSMHKGMRSW